MHSLRHLFPLALMSAAATAAQAQNVTIYGILDAPLELVTNVGPSGAKLVRMPGLTGSLPSRLGFRGSEDLGNGLRAVFTMETGFSVDAGGLNQGGRFMGRQAFVGLAGNWGSVTLGRQYTMLFLSQFDADILGPSIYGSGSLDPYLPNARVDNSVAYLGTFGGLKVGATYSLGRDAVNAGPSPAGTNCPGESATDKQACREWSAMAKYDTANWGVVAAVDELRGGPGAFAGLTSSALKDRRWTMAGWYRLSALKLGAGLIARDNDGSATTPKSNLWYVGASYAATPKLTLDAQFFKLDYKNSANEAKLLAVRGMYSFSKRTAVYATAGRIDNEGTLALSVSGAAPGSAPAAGAGQTGLAVGVRHAF